MPSTQHLSSTGCDPQFYVFCTIKKAWGIHWNYPFFIWWVNDFYLWLNSLLFTLLLTRCRKRKRKDKKIKDKKNDSDIVYIPFSPHFFLAEKSTLDSLSFFLPGPFSPSLYFLCFFLHSTLPMCWSPYLLLKGWFIAKNTSGHI